MHNSGDAFEGLGFGGLRFRVLGFRGLWGLGLGCGLGFEGLGRSVRRALKPYPLL